MDKIIKEIEKCIEFTNNRLEITRFVSAPVNRGKNPFELADAYLLLKKGTTLDIIRGDETTTEEVDFNRYVYKFGNYYLLDTANDYYMEVIKADEIWAINAEMCIKL